MSCILWVWLVVFFFKQKTAYGLRISDWSSDVCSSDLASMEAIDQLRARLGLDRPIPVQYVEFMAGVLTGDWGISMVSGRPVIQEILKVLPATPIGRAASRERVWQYV